MYVGLVSVADTANASVVLTVSPTTPCGIRDHGVLSMPVTAGSIGWLSSSSDEDEDEDEDEEGEDGNDTKSSS